MIFFDLMLGDLPNCEEKVDFPWSAFFGAVCSVFLNFFPLWLLLRKVIMPDDHCSVSYRSEREGSS